MVLETVRSASWVIEVGTNNSSRTAHSNGRAGKAEGSNASRGNVHWQGGEWRVLDYKSRH